MALTGSGDAVGTGDGVGTGAGDGESVGVGEGDGVGVGDGDFAAVGLETAVAGVTVESAGADVLPDGAAHCISKNVAANNAAACMYLRLSSMIPSAC